MAYTICHSINKLTWQNFRINTKRKCQNIYDQYGTLYNCLPGPDHEKPSLYEYKCSW